MWEGVDGRDGVHTVAPAYGGGSLSDLLPSVVTALGVPGYANILTIAPARQVVVFLIDGMGAELIAEHSDAAPFLAACLADPSAGRILDAGYPATTATSLGSFATGLPPGAHGMLGYKIRVPGTDRLINLLRWDAAVDPAEWQPHRTVFEAAAEDGVAVSHVSARRFVDSGLTRSVFRGTEYQSAESGEDRIGRALQTLASGDRSLVYLYYSDLDATGHIAGVSSPEWGAQLEYVDGLVRTLADRLPADAALFVTADHGMVDVPPDHRVDVDQDPELRAGLALLGGEGRARHLYSYPGAARDVRAIWSERLEDNGLVRLREEAIAEGWFGPPAMVDPAMATRIGDVVVALQDDWAVVATRRESLESQLVGMHGSLTTREQRIPLIELRG